MQSNAKQCGLDLHLIVQSPIYTQYFVPESLTHLVIYCYFFLTPIFREDQILSIRQNILIRLVLVPITNENRMVK